jgi:DNA polymerase alpha-associated DNA helicase A
VCEIIVEGVKKGWKILACGPSNIAVDNIVEGIAGRVDCTRIGNPARIIDSVL